MIRASVSHARNNLSALLGQVKAGEIVVITDHDRPVAQLTAINARSWGDQVEEMAKLGLVRLPVTPTLTLKEIQANRVDTGSNVGVLDALLQERRDGR